MSLKERIEQDIKEAMRAKAQTRLLALRAIKSAILLLLTSEGRTNPELTAEEELQILVKQAKQRRDSIEQFHNNGRADLAEKEEAELAVIEEYLPKKLSESELEDALKAIIAELGASGPKEMGKVMGIASKRLQGQADGKLISEKVKALLNG